MEDVLRSRGLFRITSGKETEPTNDDKKIKWENRCNEAHGLIGMSISTDLWFHIFRIDEPDLAWEKLESVFGKHNEIRGHQLENELISLNPNDFSCIQDYLSKYKTLRLLCTECKIKKKTNNVFIIFFQNMDLHILFLYLHSTPWKNPWLQIAIKSLVLNPFVIP